MDVRLCVLEIHRMKSMRSKKALTTTFLPQARRVKLKKKRDKT